MVADAVVTGFSRLDGLQYPVGYENGVFAHLGQSHQFTEMAARKRANDKQALVRNQVRAERFRSIVAGQSQSRWIDMQVMPIGHLFQPILT